MTENKQKRHWFQFGMGVLLLAIECLAAVFAGFRLGFDRGYSSGENKLLDETVEPVVYNVGDLLQTGKDGSPDYLSLIDALTATIERQSWSDVGGVGSIQPAGAGQLIISQTPPVHLKIRDLLQSMRDGRQKDNLAKPK